MRRWWWAATGETIGAVAVWYWWSAAGCRRDKLWVFHHFFYVVALDSSYFWEVHHEFIMLLISASYGAYKNNERTRWYDNRCDRCTLFSIEISYWIFLQLLAGSRTPVHFDDAIWNTVLLLLFINLWGQRSEMYRQYNLPCIVFFDSICMLLKSKSRYYC